MFSLDWRFVRNQIDIMGQVGEELLRADLEKHFNDPEIKAKAVHIYQNELHEYDSDTRAYLAASRVLSSLVLPIEERFKKKICDFIETPEIKAFVENEKLPQVARDRICIHELGEMNRKHIDSVQEEFAKKLAPLIQEAAPNLSFSKYSRGILRLFLNIFG